MTTPNESPRRPVPLDRVLEARGKKRVAVSRSKVAGTKAFRRVRSDRVLGVVGVLAVIAATWLVFTWEKPPEVTPTVAVEWPVTARSGFEGTISTSREAPEATETLAITEANVTRLQLHLQWIDDVGDQPGEYDKLDFNISGPNGATFAQTYQGAADHVAGINVTLGLKVMDKPNIQQVNAATVSQAKTIIGDQTRTNGTGTWTIRVTLLEVHDDFADNTSRSLGDCPDQGIPAVCTRDFGQDVRVALTYETYHVVYPSESPD